MLHNMLYVLNILEYVCQKKRPISFTLLIVLSTNTKAIMAFICEFGKNLQYSTKDNSIYLLFPKQTLVLTNLYNRWRVKNGFFWESPVIHVLL